MEATNPSTWPFHPLTHSLQLICWVRTHSLQACCLFTQLTHCCLMFGRSQTEPGGGLQLLSCKHTHMPVTFLSSMPLSESVGGSWFVPKPVVVNMQVSGCDTQEIWRLYQSFLCNRFHCVLFSKPSEIFKERRICDPQI